MKKFLIQLIILLLPITVLAKTVNIHFYSADPNLDATAVLSYRLCTYSASSTEGCPVSEIKQFKFHAFTGENKTQFMIDDKQSVIGFELSVNHKKPLYINTPVDLNQSCKSVNEGDTLIIQPSTDGLYACNGEMSRL